MINNNLPFDVGHEVLQPLHATVRSNPGVNSHVIHQSVVGTSRVAQAWRQNDPSKVRTEKVMLVDEAHAGGKLGQVCWLINLNALCSAVHTGP